MSFGQPWMLLLLVLPAGLLAWLWLRRGGRVVLPFDHGAPGSGRILRGILFFGEMLPPLLLSVAILLLASPQSLSAPKLKRSLTNIQFCLDISYSMVAPFGNGSRYDAAMEAVNKFIEYRQGDAFGLTFFGHSVLHWVPLTTDTSAFRHATPFMRPEKVPPWFHGTAIGKALLECRQILIEREEGDRMILLISDGESMDLYNGQDEEVARRLRNDNIVVYAVNIQDGDAPGTVVNIARLTGGDVFHVVDPPTLEAVFKHIDQMQKTRLEKGASEYVDDFWPFGLAGLILLSLLLLFHLAGLRTTPW